jgi:hypothetical protein
VPELRAEPVADIMRRLVTVVLVVCLVLATALGALLWRVSRAPLSLAWLQPTLQEMVRQSSPYAITFTEPSLVWEPAADLVGLRVHDFAARTEDGRLVATAPVLQGAVALRPLLLERRLELVRAKIELPQIELSRGEDGRLALRLDRQLAAVPLGETTDGGGLAALLGDTPGSGDSRLARLQRVEVQAPLLRFEDTASGTQASASDALFALTRKDEGWSATLAAKVGDGRISATAEAAATPPQQDLAVELQNIQPKELTALFPELPLAGLALPVSGTVQFPFDPMTGERGAATVDLSARGGEIGAAGLGLEPVAVREARLRGRLEPGWQEARIEEMRLVGEGFALGAAGRIGQIDGRLVLDAEIEAEKLDIAETLRLWPTALAEDARAWIAGNVSAGQIGGATLRIGGRGARPGQESLGGSLAFSEVELRYMDGFPPASGVVGTASWAGDSLALRATSGRTGEVELGKSEVTLSNLLGAGVVQLKAKLELRSTLPAAMRLLDAKPVELGRTTGLSASRASGRQATTLTLQLPLIEPLPQSRIVYRADARLSNAELREVSPGYSVAADSLVVVAQPSGVSANGQARVNGVAFAVDLRTDNARNANVQRRLSATGRVDRAAAERLKIAWPAMIDGPVGVDANIAEGRSPLRRVELKLDLRDAAVTVPELLLAKRRGEAGAGSATLIQRGATDLAVEQAQLTLPGWDVRGGGTMRLDPLRPQRLTLTRMRSPQGDLTGEMTLASGIWRGRVDIGTFDVRPLVWRDTGAGGAGSGGLPDFTMQLAARSLRLGETPFSNLSGFLDHRGGQWRSARVQGNIDRSDISLDLTALGASTTFNVRGNDAGWAIRSISSHDHGVRGGRLQLSANLRPSSAGLSGTGELKIREFTMWGAPTIARIVSLASFTGLAHALSGQGIPVSRVIAPFRLQGDVITLDQARLVASDIGARADGTIDVARQQVDVTGTVAPAYTINRILGRIPILGALMSGTRSDALLAASFSVRGPLAEPRVTVNPLTALVPGVIRDLFGGFDTDPRSTRE